MKARLVFAVALLSAAACADEQKRQVSPTAPSASTALSKSVVRGASGGGSTVCLRYARDQALAHADLKDHPASERVQKRVKSLDQLVQDACQ